MSIKAPHFPKLAQLRVNRLIYGESARRKARQFAAQQYRNEVNIHHATCRGFDYAYGELHRMESRIVDIFATVNRIETRINAR